MIPSQLSKNTKQSSQSLTHRTLMGLFWAFSSAGVQSILKIIVMAILARLLTPADFGLIGAAMIVISFSEIFSLMGLAPAIIQRPNLESRHICTGFTVSLLFGLVLAGVLWLLAPIIANFFSAPNLPPFLRTLTWLFPLSSISVVSKALLARDLQFRKLAGIQIFSYILGYSLVGISLAFIGFGPWAVVWAYLAQAAFDSVLSFLIQPHSVRPRLEPKAFKELAYFGGGMTVVQVFNHLALKGDNLVVGRWLGIEALGLYERAYNLMAASVTLYARILDKVLFPTLAKVQDDPRRLAMAYRRGVSLVALVVLPISVTAFVLAPEIIYVLLGPYWLNVTVPFQILAAGMLFRAGYRMTAVVARSTGAVYRLAWQQATYMALIIGGAWMGQHWGLSGVAFGVVGALGFNFLYMARLGLRLTSLTWRDFYMAHFPALLLSAIILIESLLISTSLRELNVLPPIILVVSVLATAFTLLVLLYFVPQTVLGQEGVWMVRILSQYIPKHLRFRGRLKKVIENATLWFFMSGMIMK